MYIHQEAPLDAQQAARQQLQHIKAKEEEIKISKIIENNKYYPINQIRDLYEYGFSVRNISEEYKINLSTLYRIFKRNNIILKDNKNK